MTRRKMTIAALLGSAFIGAVALAGLAEHYGVLEDDDDDEGPALTKSIGDAKVSLQEGLAASEQAGQPISGKFEVEDGRFQLSVYTTKDGNVSEVLVDHVTGKVGLPRNEVWRESDRAADLDDGRETAKTYKGNISSCSDGEILSLP